MKNKILKVLARMGFAGLAVMTLGLQPRKVMAAANDTIQAQLQAQIANSAYVNGAQLTAAQVQVSTWIATSNAALNIWYTGPSTAAYVSVLTGGSNSSNCMTFYAPYNVLDTTIGQPGCGNASSSIDLGVSTATSMGQVCDLINAAQAGNVSSNYHCKLLATIRNDNASVFIATQTETSGVNPLNQVGGYNIQIGTNTIISLGITPVIDHRVELTQCQVYSANTNFQVYGRKLTYAAGYDQQGNPVYDSALVWNSNITASSLSYLPQQYDLQPWIEFSSNKGNVSTVQAPSGVGYGAYRPFQTPTGNVYDGHVVVRSGYAGAGNSPASNTSSDYINCTWFEK